VPAKAGASLRLEIPPDARHGRSVRERVSEFACAHDVPPADADEFVTAVSEALANAIEHSGTPDAIEVACWISGDKLVATIVDHGVGFDTDRALGGADVPEPLSERGRGLPIMRRYTDLFSISSVPGKGTSVTLGRSVRYGAPQSLRAGGRTAFSSRTSG
jgi:anti-sigma regulatory factor (Ser/Thr protein kinase)